MGVLLLFQLCCCLFIEFWQLIFLAVLIVKVQGVLGNGSHMAACHKVNKPTIAFPKGCRDFKQGVATLGPLGQWFSKCVPLVVRELRSSGTQRNLRIKYKSGRVSTKAIFF